MELPLIIWNHRWEYDKNPDDFFKLLFDLKDRGVKFELVVLGEKYKKNPPIFDEAKSRLSDEIIHFGYLESIEEYKSWLLRADIIPITSNQDFFGESLVQAMMCNCYPLIPDRLAFKEHFPEEELSNHIYHNYDELVVKMVELIENINNIRSKDIACFVSHYKWENIIEVYDSAFEKMILDE